jgi:serine/threonine protein kinase/tetratricopeptide (TPR) repeat protein
MSPAEGGTGPPGPERWQRIEELADAALDLPPGEREAWLRTTCGADVRLHAEVMAVLEAGEREDAFLSPRAVPLAADLRPSLQTAGAVPGAPLPHRVGPYRVVREIGRGGMGTVYLAEREEHFAQRVAVKVVGRGPQVDQHLVQRFVEERQLLARLEHANIARVLDGGLTDEGLPWFAMEFVAGEPIDSWCDTRRLAIEARLELFCTVCDAVEYAHDRRIVHRDLKPSNVLIRSDGVVKLLDFGIAKLVAPERGTADAFTNPGLRLLTPEYASPEQIRGDTASPRSDVYSLGVLLYELVAGRRPVRRSRGSRDPREAERTRDPERPSAAVLGTEGAAPGSEPGQRAPPTPTGVARARNTTPERLSERLRGELDDVVLKTLAMDPKDRYPSAGALAGDLRRHLEGLPVTARPRSRRRPILFGMLAAVLAVAATAGLWARLRGHSPAGDGPPVLAVGLIADHRVAGTPGDAGPLADLLATNLARIPSLRVVSTARLYELMALLDGERQTGPGAYSGAARRAGAAMLVDGSLYAVGGDSLRLDLRRIDVESGEVLAVHSIAARDIFTLVDSGTARLAGGLGAALSLGSVADVTTHSEAAYRFYQEGLRAHYRGEQVTARGLLQAALREDSMLAMASYYLAQTQPNTDLALPAMERALQSAPHASEREQRIIQTGWMVWTSDPGAIAAAESLITRYPHELHGHLLAGQAFALAGDYVAALRHLRHVVVTDSVALEGASARCSACDARLQIIVAYVSLDSLAAAEREAVAWTAFEPDRATAWHQLAQLRSLLGKSEGGLEAYRRAAEIDPTLNGQPSFFALNYLGDGEYARVDRELTEIARSGAPNRVAEAYWYLTISLRQQGRLREALEAAREYRLAASQALPNTAPESFALHQAQVLFEMGRHAESAALFDSIARAAVGISPSHRARNRTWSLALGGNAMAARGDTARLAARIDTVRLVGTRSLLARDRLLHHHLRGLLLAARGADEAAVAEFRLAIAIPTGYTRTPYERARALLRLGRPREAVAVQQPAIRSPIEGSGLYLTTTDGRALLAEAWDSAGGRDSALAHYRIVLHAWERADPHFASRVAAIQARVRALDRIGAVRDPRD